MKDNFNQDFLTQIFIFLASVSTTLYALFSTDNNEAIKRNILIGKILGSVIVAFFLMPAVKEYFNLSMKVTLFFTVIVAYGLEGLLKASVRKLTKTINKDENNDTDN